LTKCGYEGTVKVDVAVGEVVLESIEGKREDE